MSKHTDPNAHSLRAALGGIALLALIFSALAIMPRAVDAQNRYSLKIKNNSRFDIALLYMSTAEIDDWGPDQLGDNLLVAGGTFTITNIRPGEYDIKFVDEDGDACVLRNIQMFEHKSWVLTTEWLLKCEGFRRHN